MKNIEGVVLASFSIAAFYVPRNSEPRIQIQDTKTGKLYESTLAFYIDHETRELCMNVVRHFTDPDSQAWFPDSEPWPVELLDEDTVETLHSA